MNKKNGFTLIELLVAIAIFAILSALGWKVFEHVAHVKDRNIVREQSLAELQRAYQIILKDSLQVIPMTANVNNSIEPALSLQNGRLIFSKSGVIDPLEQAKPPFERIEYIYKENDKTILRLRYPNLNYSNDEQPESSVFLRNVDDFKITVLNPNEMESWPVNLDDIDIQEELPKGLKFKLTQNGVDYEWLFSLLNRDMQGNNNDIEK